MWTIDYLESHGEQRSGWRGEDGWKKLYHHSLFVLWPLVSSLYEIPLEGATKRKRALEIFDSLKSNNLFRAIIFASELDEHQILKQFGPLLWEEARSSHEKKPAEEVIERSLEAAWSVVTHSPKNAPKPDLASRIREDQKDRMELTSDDYSLIGAICLVVGICSAFWALGEWIKPSPELKSLLPIAKKNGWARKLIRKGPLLAERIMWKVEKAWPMARDGMTEEEKSKAVRWLAKNFENGEIVEPALGDPFNKEEANCRDNSGEWIFELLRPGLKLNGQVLEHASVQSASADFLSLHCTSENRLTKEYLCSISREKDRESYDLRLEDYKIREVALMADYSERNEWICSLANHSPREELVPLSPEVGAPFDERCMVNFGEDVVNVSEAQVAKVLCSGLKRANGDLLLKANIEARDP